MKRYIRTKDGKIWDTNWYHDDFTNEEVPYYDFYEKGGFIYLDSIIAEADNIFDLIIKGDLVEYKDDDNDTWLEDIKKSWEDYKETSLINKIYTKQNEDYCLVWDKERGII